jgi:D-glycero-D-manno-heptose 1,7-bisphosphate phosphatase
MGTSPVILLDRDGTINVERNYLSHPDEVELLPGAAEGLRLMQDRGATLVVITNQSGIGRGYFDETRLDAIHDRLRSLLEDQGVRLETKIYVCPHHPDDGCVCRKPAGGLVDQAAAEIGFEPEVAFVIGDKASDIEMGQRFGATTILVRTGYGAAEEAQRSVWPDFVVEDLVEAAELVDSITGDAWRIRRHLKAGVARNEMLLRDSEHSILAAADAIVGALRRGGKLMICGNGGSAADAQHLAAEFVSLLDTRFPRPGIAAIALTTDTSFLTAYSNDFDYEGVFERQVQALGHPHDVVLGISTSGNSANVVRALHYARDAGMATVALTGGRGGKLSEIAEVAVRVPSTRTALVQEGHLAIEHVITELVERALFPGVDRSV